MLVIVQLLPLLSTSLVDFLSFMLKYCIRGVGSGLPSYVHAIFFPTSRLLFMVCYSPLNSFAAAVPDYVKKELLQSIRDYLDKNP